MGLAHLFSTIHSRPQRLTKANNLRAIAEGGAVRIGIARRSEAIVRTSA
jgi:hypothetical protein